MIQENDTSNGGYRREEKSHKRLSSVTAIFFLVRLNKEQLYVLIVLKIREK